MTDLVARLVAALHEVRDRTAHALRCDLLKAPSVWAVIERGHNAKPEWVVVGCSCDWQQRVDARLAACVEAYGEAVGLTAWQNGAAKGDDPRFARGPVDPYEAGLAAFLAAAAQEEAR